MPGLGPATVSDSGRDNGKIVKSRGSCAGQATPRREALIGNWRHSKVFRNSSVFLKDSRAACRF